MTTVYKVLTAIDYKGERKRNLFYTESREEAENQYNKAQEEIRRFSEEKGLKLYDVKHNEGYRTFFADGKDFQGARAEFICHDTAMDDYLDFYNDPIF
jgi:hypothetical protein